MKTKETSWPARPTTITNARNGNGRRPLKKAEKAQAKAAAKNEKDKDETVQGTEEE